MSFTRSGLFTLINFARERIRGSLSCIRPKFSKEEEKKRYKNELTEKSIVIACNIIACKIQKEKKNLKKCKPAVSIKITSRASFFADAIASVATDAGSLS